MKNQKVGGDEILAEFWKLLGDKAQKQICNLCRNMYEEGVWPKDFTRIVMIPLQKKNNAIE